MTLFKTYSETIRVAAKTRRISIRDLANATGYTYEHMRKIWMGRTPKRENVRLTIGQDCNDRLCEILGLPKEAMWELAEREKFAQKTGYEPMRLPDPLGQELSELWASLTHEQKNVLLRMAHSLSLELANAS